MLSDPLPLPSGDGGVRLPLASGQREIWFSQARSGRQPAFRIAEYLEIGGPVRPPLLEAAIRRVVTEAEPLGVRFGSQAGVPWQTIDTAREWEFPVFDVSSRPDPREAAEEWMRGDLNRPRDLEREPLFSYALFTLAADRYALYHSFHHIVVDAAGGALVMRRIAEVYTALAEGGTPPESPFGSLRRLIERDTAYQSSPERAADRAHWAAHFARRPAPAPLTTGTDTDSGAVSAPASLRETVHLDDRQADRLRTAARAAGVHWSVVLLATTAAYVHRHTGASDIVIGLPVTARTDAELRALPGMLANVVPLRLCVSADTRLRDLLRQASREARRALRHQRYRCVDLARDLRLPDAGRDFMTAQINVMSFAYDFTFAGHPVTARNLSTGVTGELNVVAYDRADGTGLRIDFNAPAGPYTRSGLAGHRDRYQRLLNAFCDLSSPDRTVGGADLLSEPERRRVLVEWNATARAVPAVTLTELLTAQAGRTPDRLAVLADEDGQQLTYAELHTAADRLAGLLREHGARPGARVAVALPRRPGLLVALLAVLNTGAAYLPLDPEQPAERLGRMLTDAAPVLVVTEPDATAASALTEPDRVPRLLIDGRGAAVAGRGSALVPPPGPAAARPEDPAYLIYTSGSTGRPKGVLVPHRAIVNRLLWMQDTYRLTGRDRVLQKTSTGFDVSVWELFWPLISGAVLVLARPGGHRDQRYVARVIREQGITTAHFVPSVLDAFLAEPAAAGCDRLRQVFSSGEALPRSTAERFHTLLPRTALHNLYGPTEAAVDVTHHRCVPGATGPVPIGRPVWNTRLYVLDAALQPCAPGMPGELYLAGAQLATGYHARPELTAERFPADPFAELFGAPGSRMYRTGDLAGWLPDGSVEYLGRTDDQVKLRGVRIELGEVESALRALPGIAQAAARVIGERLVGYVTERPAAGSPHHGTDPAEARRRLALTLPEPMVPADLVVLDSLPLHPSGKLDRNALPDPGHRTGAAGPRPGPDTREARLAALFGEVLDLEGLGADADFFQLGGHSLLAARLLARVHEVFGTELPIRTLFEAPTVAQLAKQLDQAEPAPDPDRCTADRDPAHGDRNPADRVPPHRDTRDRDRVPAHRETSGSLTPWDRLDPLLSLRGDGGAPPLFCIHPGSGLGGAYAGLLRHLGRARPLHALQAVGLTAPERAMPAAVEEMAADYVRRIKTVRPSGPYHLLGWSFGGLVAHAMATRLQSRGEQVGVLAVLDAYPDNRRILSGRTEPSEEQWLRLALDFAAGFPGDPGPEPQRTPAPNSGHQEPVRPAADTDTLIAALRRTGLPEPLLRDPLASPLLGVVRNNLTLSSRFTPQVFDGDLLLFTAEQAVPGYPADPAHTPRQWQRHVTGTVHAHGVPAHHFHLLHPGPLAHIGPLLAAALTEAD
ncbi:amino acid adenylation domain-containing protein [Streptomyces sp. NPDC003691]